MKSKLISTTLVILLVLGLLTPSIALCQQAEPVRKLSAAVAWVRISDEYKSCVQQAYDNAALRLPELVEKLSRGSWCVVFDMDETLVSNVQYEAELEMTGKEFSEESWTEWCNRGEATILPGVMDFVKKVKMLGGKVVIITNRNASQKEGSLKNLENLGIPCDAVIFQEGPYAKDSRKTQRRMDLMEGTLKTLPEGQALPPLKIVMLAGDQANDLYDSSKLSFEDIKKCFTYNFIMLPNPMYGGFLSKPGAVIPVTRTDSGKPVKVEVTTPIKQ